LFNFFVGEELAGGERDTKNGPESLLYGLPYRLAGPLKTGVHRRESASTSTLKNRFRNKTVLSTLDVAMGQIDGFIARCS
jgi:hypothetical protein